MKIMNKTFCDYQKPTAVVMDVALEGVLCLSQPEETGFVDSTMENLGREEFEW